MNVVQAILNQLSIINQAFLEQINGDFKENPDQMDAAEMPEQINVAEAPAQANPDQMDAAEMPEQMDAADMPEQVNAVQANPDQINVDQAFLNEVTVSVQEYLAQINAVQANPDQIDAGQAFLDQVNAAIQANLNQINADREDPGNSNAAEAPEHQNSGHSNSAEVPKQAKLDVEALGQQNSGHSNAAEVPEQAKLDVELHIGDDVIMASKAKLCACSLMFRSMFAHDVVESQTSVVKIKKFNVDLVKEFVHFIHTGEFRGLGRVAKDLYELADYYDVESLKARALDSMIHFLTTDNAAEFFEFADDFDLDDAKTRALNMLKRGINTCNYYERYIFAMEHDFPALKSAVFYFIKKNLWEVVKTEDWSKFPDTVRLNLLESQAEDPVASLTTFLEKQLTMTIDRDLQFRSETRLGNPVLNDLDLELYIMRNTGRTHLAYKILSNFDGNDLLYVFPSEGMMAPGDVNHVRISCRGPNAHAVPRNEYLYKFTVLFEETRGRIDDLENCFKFNSFCRQVPLCHEI